MYQMMNYLLFFGLSMAFLFPGAQMATFTIRNNCQFTIWPATLSGANKPQLSKTGFELAPQASDSVDAPSLWEGRIWARTQCSSSSGKFTCGTGDCGSGQVACNGGGGVPPASLAEIFVGVVNERQSVHDISLVDGFNLPLSITPQGGSGSTCAESKCQANVNSVCPSQLAVRGSDGNTIGCKSACAAFNEPQYCCTGEFEPRDKCQPTDYSRIFSDQCPEAYSYAYKDGTSTFTCEGVPNYLITFCP